MAAVQRLYGIAMGVMLTVLAMPGRAATPTEELLHRVPTDSALCLGIQNLRSHVDTLRESPFAMWAWDRFGNQWKDSPELMVIRGVVLALENQLGITLEEIRNDILGDAIVLAYTPGPADQPEAERGVLLLHARDPKKLTTLVERLNALQLELREITAVAPRKHLGVEYFSRTKSDGTNEYYLQSGQIFAFSGQEDAIHHVIARSQSKELSPIARSLASMDTSASFLFAWLNPRALDADVEQQATQATTPQQDAFIQQFARVWRGMDAVSLTVTLHKELEIGLAIQYAPERLPEPIRALLDSPPVATSLWERAPETAFLVVSAHVPPAKILAAIQSFLPAGEQASLYKSFQKHVGAIVGKQTAATILPQLGPDWGFWLSPPRPANPTDNTWIPEAVFALHMSSAVQPHVRRVVDFWVQMLAVDYNQKHEDQIELRDQPIASQAFTTLVNAEAFPTGFQPTYGLGGGYLIASSSHQATERFLLAPEPRQSVPQRPQGVPLVKISARHLREYLTSHQAPLVDWLAARDQDQTPEKIQQDLQQLTQVLEALDQLELRLKNDKQILQLTLQIKTREALAK